MSQYHVGIGLAGIYAGRVQNGEWLDKSDVTNVAVAAVAMYLLESNRSFRFTQSGKTYRLIVEEVDDHGQETN